MLTIHKDYPNHWEIAKENGLWDMAKRMSPIKKGDVVYFWLSQHGFVGRVEVSVDATALTGVENLPWTDDGERLYVGRFRFDRASDLSARQVSWASVMESTGLSANPSLRHSTTDSAAEAWLSSLFTTTTTEDDAERAFATAESAAAELADLKEDTRERALAEIAVRRGQGQFRTSLLSTYGRRCAVTGTAEGAVLEAAHISPYRGTHTNIVANGLLLRSDIHTLFDLHLLTVQREGGYLVVRVSPAVVEMIYRELDGRPVRHLPDEPQDFPSTEALADHNQGCPWLSGRYRVTVDYSRS
ncbi:HNH endonuclease signature motif containing protein [Georgenia sp. M64]|uniref:HNH endonuclease n=1 Tax=Georgenia sp. M64 TaxID=3120520 RepID=UPI0030DEC3EB